MWTRILKILLCATVCLGILFPKLTGVMSAFLPNLNYVSICTGYERVVLLIDGTGTPVKSSQEGSTDCPLPEDREDLALPLPYWQKLLFEHKTTREVTTNIRLHADHFARLPLRRPPPYLV